MRRAVWVTAGIIGALPGTAGAWPDADPAEVPLLAPGAPAGATGRGKWSTGAPLRLESRPTHGDATWLAGPTIGDGVVRATIDDPSSGDLALLLRVTADPAQPEDYSGYGLVLTEEALQLWRWDHGIGLPMAPGVGGAWWRGHQGVEVVVLAAGPWLAAFVADADTLEPIAELTARDPTYRAGRVGVLAASPTEVPAPVRALSVGRAEDTRPEPGPIGEERLVTVAKADLPLLPRDLGALARPDPVHPDRVELVVDAVQAERIRRHLHPLAVGWEVPFRVEDPAYNARRDQPAKPIGGGLDLAASYLNPAQVAEVLRAAHASFPDLTRLVELGTSAEGRPLLALVVSDHAAVREDEPAVLLDGAHHGNELLSVSYPLDALQVLLEGRDRPEVRRWIEGLEIWVVPVVNPDGTHRYLEVTTWAGRKNAPDTNGDGVVTPWDGADLNRNYPFRWGALGETGSRSFPRMPMYRGAAPGSEPEVQAMMRLAEAERFVAAISFHTSATAILSPYTVDGARNPQPDVAWSIAEAMAAAAPAQPGGKRYQVRRKLYSVDGTSQDWLFHTFGTLAWIVEGSAKNPVDPAVRRASIEGTRPVWQALFDRLLAGPSVAGHVTDGAGAPVEAEVRVSGFTLSEGERWTSRPADGRFERLLPGPGVYTVKASAPGKGVAEATLRVDGRATVELVLRAP